jgi:hypothetical protein
MRKQANEIEEYTDFDSFLGSNKSKRKKVKIRLFNRTTVSRHFRRHVAEAFPALEQDEVGWRMMQYLFFGHARDRVTRKRLLSHATLAEIAGHKGNPSNFKSGQFLQKFRDTYFSADTFSWTPHLSAEKCRQVETLILPESLQRALTDEYARKHYSTGRIYFDTGETYSVKTQRRERRMMQKSATDAAREAKTREAREILDYLNNLPPHLFTRIVGLNHEAAVKVAMSLEKENAREQQLNILKQIREQPQTFYRPVTDGNTDRVFGVGGGFTGLKREVRNALIQGWHKADLRSAQLAINAMLWDVPEIKTFLRKKHRSIWQELYEHFELTDEEATRAKPALKTALYAACYGMGVRKIGKNLTTELDKSGITRNGNLFTKHPLIKALLAGRKRAVTAIQRDGGGRTCFGKWLSEFELTTPQILAQISQAIELKIMHAIFEVAATTSDFTITLFQHDGIAVHFTDKSKAEKWKKRITRAVDTEAKRLAVETTLEWEFEKKTAAIFSDLSSENLEGLGRNRQGTNVISLEKTYK